jgi:hypothetical protein
MRRRAHWTVQGLFRPRLTGLQHLHEDPPDEVAGEHEKEVDADVPVARTPRWANGGSQQPAKSPSRGGGVP